MSTTTMDLALAQDYGATPGLRLRDWAAAHEVAVADYNGQKVVTDNYRLVPARSFGAQGNALVADLAPGRYEVPNLKADPKQTETGAPIVADLIEKTLREAAAPLRHETRRGFRTLVADPGGSLRYVMVDDDGTEWWLDQTLFDGLVGEAKPDTGDPEWFEMSKGSALRYRVYGVPGEPHRPVVVERVAYSSANYVDGKRTVRIGGTWQGILQPVRLPEEKQADAS